MYREKCSNPHCDNYFNPDFAGFVCPFCDRLFCEQCAENETIFCENCKLAGCKDCMKYDKETGFYFCCSECKEEFKENEKN